MILADVDEEEFTRWYGRWSPLSVRAVASLLRDFAAPWWIVGGYAIERFTGAPRRHEDIDVVVLRPDAVQLLPILAAEYHVWANSSGTLTPMLDNRLELPPTTGQLWVRRDAQSPWEVDFGVAEERDGRWVWRHDPTVTIAVADLTWTDEDGVRFARPEIVLAHKAKWRQHRDDVDFDAAWPLLGDRARTWLHGTVATMYPDHPWLSRMT